MFRTTFKINTLDKPITVGSSIFSIGSCFSENITKRLEASKLNTLSNPFGILYNPTSLAQSLRRHMHSKWMQPQEIFEFEGLYRAFDFHSNLAKPGKQDAILTCNNSIRNGKIFLDNCTHLFITFGTSRVYQFIETKTIVGNNHKLPANLFSKVQLQVEDIVLDWKELIAELRNKYPTLKIIFTLSPVRHLKDGAVENALSKATLLQSIHELIKIYPDLYYFPAYEIMMDDLRDYRFYEKDMIHPNEIAIDYIWEIFKTNCISERQNLLIAQMDSINSAMQHRPFYPDSQQHQSFKQLTFKKLEVMQEEFPEVDFTNEKQHFI